MLPFLAIGAGASAAAIADNLLGRPFDTWTRTVAAANEAEVRSGGYQGNWRAPNVLPSPTALLEAWRRGFLSSEVAADALIAQGISWAGASRAYGDQLNPGAARWYRNLWRNVTDLNISRPDAASVMQLSVRGRLDQGSFTRLWGRLGADHARWREVIEANYQLSQIDTILRQYRLGRITGEQYLQGAAALGWTNATWRNVAETDAPLPGLYDLMRQNFIGTLRPGEYARYAQALGHTDARTRALVEASYYQIPSGPELVQLAVRDAWNEDVVRQWGYDAEFPAPMQYWMRAQGWDWGKTFRGDDGRNYPAIHWPKLFWRAHWQPISPGQAYQAWRRLRPERIGRYLADFPDLKPFTTDDLKTVLRVHDYPPTARDWLGALSAQPLQMFTIRTAYSLGVRDRAWALEQLLDIGYLREDAGALLDTLDAREERRRNAWLYTLDGQTAHATAKEVVAGYGDGFVPLQDAINRLGDLGVGSRLARRLLSLEDSRQLRSTLRQYLAAVRRDYLAGTMTDTELSARLQQAQIAAPAAQRYVARWTGQRSLERRSLSSGQVAAQVAAGALSPAAGIARLLNLGWIEPDAALLIQQAQARLLQSQARAAQQAARQARADQKALLAAQRSAQQALSQSQSRLRRITPLATLKRWYCLGIRKADWILGRLLSQGYDTTASADYLREWAMECESGPLSEAPAVHTREKLVARQTPRSVLKSWWQNGIATDAWIRQRLAVLGFTAESVDRYISEWRATLGRKPGPKQGR